MVLRLHLCFEQSFSYIHPARSETYDTVKNHLDEDVKPFLRLRNFGAKIITVMLSDHNADFAIDSYGTTERERLRWTAAQKTDYAAKLRSQLADPQGAKLVKADLEAEKQAALHGSLESAWHKAVSAYAWVARATIKAANISNEAEDYGKVVEAANKKAQRAFSKNAPNADLLRATYEEEKAVHSLVKGEADKAAQTVERARARAEDTAAKYQRAILRAGDQAAVARLHSEEVVETEDDDDSYDDGSSYDKDEDSFSDKHNKLGEDFDDMNMFTDESEEDDESGLSDDSS